jgi:hypothetical protein
VVLNVYVFMFWVTLDDLLVGYNGMSIKKKRVTIDKLFTE